jgi:hypothetical protein
VFIVVSVFVLVVGLTFASCSTKLSTRTTEVSSGGGRDGRMVHRPPSTKR